MQCWNGIRQCNAHQGGQCEMCIPKAWDVSLEVLPGDSGSFSSRRAALAGRLQPSLLVPAEAWPRRSLGSLGCLCSDRSSLLDLLAHYTHSPHSLLLFPDLKLPHAGALPVTTRQQQPTWLQRQPLCARSDGDVGAHGKGHGQPGPVHKGAALPADVPAGPHRAPHPLRRGGEAQRRSHVSICPATKNDLGRFPSGFMCRDSKGSRETHILVDRGHPA